MSAEPISAIVYIVKAKQLITDPVPNSPLISELLGYSLAVWAYSWQEVINYYL